MLITYVYYRPKRCIDQSLHCYDNISVKGELEYPDVSSTEVLLHIACSTYIHLHYINSLSQ